VTPLMLFVLAWVGGLVLAQAFDVEAAWLLLALPPALTLLAGWGDRPWARRASTLLLGVCLGALRLTLAQPDITAGHVAFYRGAGEVQLVGVIVADPDRRSQDTRLVVRTEQVLLPGGSASDVRGRLLIYASPYATLNYGDRIRASGHLQTAPVFQGFSYREYLARQGIHALLRSTSVEVLAQHQANPVIEGLLRFRWHAYGQLRSLLPDSAGALLAGILLGLERDIPDDVNLAFAVTGTTHIIAISGFNLTIAASVVARLAGRLAKKRPGWKQATLYLSLSTIWAYVFLVGAPPAVTRAGVMSSLIVIAQSEQRRVHGPTALAAAVLALTLWNPYTLWDVGFQLSVGAMLGLILYVPPLTRWATAGIGQLLDQARAEQVVNALSDVLIVTLAVQITTLGIMVGNFESLSIIAPLANLLILPVQPAIMLFGGLALGTGLVLPPVGSVMAWVVWVFLKYTLLVVTWLSEVSFASVTLGNVSLPLIWAYYGLLGCCTWALGRPRESLGRAWASVSGANPALLAGGAAGLALLVTYGMTQPDGRLHAVFLDAGRGDAVLIVTPTGRQILVDGGADPRSLSASLGKHLPFWDRSLDMVILTSPDDDRLAGLIPVLERYEVGFVGLSPEAGAGARYARWAELVESLPADTVRTLYGGDSLNLGEGVQLNVLWPDPGVPGPLVLHLVHEETRMLLLGDATAVVEEALVGHYGPELRSGVLQLPRGGDKTCCTHALLRWVAPEVAIVAPRGSGPIASLVTARLMHIPLYRIDQRGTVEVISNGLDVRIRTRVP
jgi:competence protein ComEC